MPRELQETGPWEQEVELRVQQEAAGGQWAAVFLLVLGHHGLSHPKCPLGEERALRKKQSLPYKSGLTCADRPRPKSRSWQVFWVKINLAVPVVNTIILFPV